MDKADWSPNSNPDEADQIDSFELPAMTAGARELVAEHRISDEDVLKIETSGTDGKLQKADVEAYVSLKASETTGLPTLEFTEFGWCHKLQPPFRYKKGFYKPKTEVEYEALREYAKAK